MKKINKQLIMARNSDLETKIKESTFFEDLAMRGLTQEEIMADVRKALGLSENDSIIAEFKEKTAAINKLQKNLVDVNGLTQRLLDDKLISESEVSVLSSIETKIAEKLVGIYDLDMEDIYLEDENEQ
jgi:hypothetical protein